MNNTLGYFKKILKFLGGILFLLVASFTGFLIYALRPGVSEQKLPRYGILQFSSPSTPQNPSSLHVMTYNIGYASGVKNNKGDILSQEEVKNNLKEMVEAIRLQKPDLLFLQEVDFDSTRTFGINQLQYLAEGLQMPYAAYVITWNKNYVAWPYWPPSRHFGRVVSGSAVLSRYPISDQQLFYSPKPTSNPFWYNWFYLDRVMQRLTLEVNGKSWNTYHVHIEAFDPKEKERQLHTLTQLVKQEPEASKIVAGDFNLATNFLPEAPIEDRDTEGMLKSFSELTGMKDAEPNPRVLSMPSWLPVKKIDHIFYEKSLHLVNSGNIPNLQASDHLPIWAEFSTP